MLNSTAYGGRVLFDHLPKTAGQAVNAWLIKSLGSGCVTPNLIGDHNDLIRQYGGEYSVISGHVHFNGSEFDPRYHYLTCFREPLDRAISWLYFVINNHDQSQLGDLWIMADRFLKSNGEDLEEALSGYISNCYVEHFSGFSGAYGSNHEEKLANVLRVVDHYDVWGLYERMPEFLADVAALIGLPAPKSIDRVNVTKERLDVSQINSQLRERLKELNALDLQLYAELKNRYEQRRVIEKACVSQSLWLPYERQIVAREFLDSGVELISFDISHRDLQKKGEVVSFSADVSFAEPVSQLEVGISIRDSENRLVFGVNTGMLSKNIKNISAGVHRFTFFFVSNMPDGTYGIGFSAIEKDGLLQKDLACFDRLCDLRVNAARLSPGVGYVDMPAEFFSQVLSAVPVSSIQNAKGRIAPVSFLRECIANQRFSCPVELTSESDQAWCGSWKHPIYLSYRWLDSKGHVVIAEGERTSLPSMQVLPGESVFAEMTIIAPDAPGEYRLMLLPLQEYVFWFDVRGFKPCILDVKVCRPGEEITFADAFCAFHSQVGQRSLNSLVSKGVEGFLLHGPYLPYPAGKYRARCFGNAVTGGQAWADAVVDLGNLVLARGAVGDSNSDGCIAELCFSLEQPVSDLEIRIWVGATDHVSVDRVTIEPVENDGFRQAAPVFGAAEIARISMTVSCDDCADVPKVEGAGSVFECDGQLVQLMHDGTRVVAGGYFGGWMQEVILQLKGHHEPQEERLFHSLLQHVRPGSLMVEIGCYWAYYSNWFVGAVPQGRALCIEPDERRLAVGMQNFRLNDREADFFVAAAGGRFEPELPFVRESDGQQVNIPVWDFGKLLEQVGSDNIELLHMDVQGAEFPFLKSIESTEFRGRLRFVVVSTHHRSISGSATTHRDCLATLINLGAFILCEHSVDESFSGDGLIVASFFAEDARLAVPHISRNQPESSLFGRDPDRAVVNEADSFGRMDAPLSLENIPLATEWVNADVGPMCVFSDDSIIGAALKRCGSFGTDKIDEVVDFLRDEYAFSPVFFVDVGTNIGTHLIHALKKTGFEKGIGFEPDPRNYALLTQNVAANGIEERTRLFRLALSSESGAATFELCGENFGDHRVRVPDIESSVELGESGRELISVLKDTGDRVFHEHRLSLNRQTLMWVDTQGHEGYVFKGFEKTMSSGEKPFVVCEFWPYGLERANGKDAFFEFIQQCARVYDINHASWKQQPQIGPADLEKMYVRMLEETRLGHYPHTDLLCVLR